MNSTNINGRWDEMQFKLAKGRSWAYFNGSRTSMDGNLIDPIDFYRSKALGNVALVRLLAEMGNSKKCKLDKKMAKRWRTIGLCWKGHYETRKGFQVRLLIAAFGPIWLNNGNDTKVKSKIELADGKNQEALLTSHFIKNFVPRKQVT